MEYYRKQKIMTKSTSGSKKAKRQKKERHKFLATAPGTKLHRIEFIETNKYVNGVRNERGGEKVIRELNDSEKEWLANFNATFEHGNFKDDFFDITDEVESEINAQDYSRRNDLYFIAKTSGNLIAYDLMEYDKFESEAEKDISAEDLKLNHLEGKLEKVSKRKRKKV
jgi:hypothetical protein